MTIRVNAAKRLRAGARTELINKVEKILDKYNIKRQHKPFPNPRMYKKPDPPDKKPVPNSLLRQVQIDLEKIGFKFHHLPIHTMDTKAVESEGWFSSVHYILDLVLRHNELEADLYY